MDTKDIDIFVYTEREGLMSAVGHDLKLRAGKFTVDRDGDHVHVEVDANSFGVDACIVDGREEKVRMMDRKVIERNISKEVLQAKKHPKVTFDGQLDGQTLAGTLTIMGESNDIDLTFDENGHGSVTIDQTDWGMEPYKALMGTLKLKRELRIEVSVPSNALS